MTQEEYRMEQKIKVWNIVATLIFASLIFFGYRYLYSNGGIPQSIPFFDFSILTLAVFRLSRLLAYDNVSVFLRESFLDVKRVSYAEGGEDHVARVPSANSLKRTLGMLFGCPWCLGVWLSLFVVFGYFVFPSLWILFVILAVAGLGSLFQILTNFVGWSAEKKKQESEHTDTI